MGVIQIDCKIFLNKDIHIDLRIFHMAFKTVTTIKQQLFKNYQYCHLPANAATRTTIIAKNGTCRSSFEFSIKVS